MLKSALAFSDWKLTQTTYFLPNVEAISFVGNSFQHLLQRLVQVTVFLLHCPDRLTITRKGCHPLSDRMTVLLQSNHRGGRNTPRRGVVDGERRSPL